MPVAFGFSVGDFIAAVKLIAQIIDALREAGNAGRHFRELVEELENLKLVLQQIQKLKLSEKLAAENIALEAAGTRCLLVIQEFCEKNVKYEKCLGRDYGNVGLNSAWMRVRWSLCKKTDIVELRNRLSIHRGDLTLLLLKVQLQANSIYAAEQEARDVQNANEMQSFASQMVTKLNTVARGVASAAQQGVVLFDTTTQIFSMTVEVLHAVQGIRDMLVPMQIQRQQPVYFTDPFNRTWPFHLECIGSSLEFMALMRAKFEVAACSTALLDQGEFRIAETRTHRLINLNEPWQACFFPGQHADMSILFHESGRRDTSCPFCFATHEQQLPGEMIDCDCGRSFQRVEELSADNIREQKRKTAQDDKLPGGEGDKAASRADPRSRPMMPVVDMTRFRRLHIMSSQERMEVHESVDEVGDDADRFLDRKVHSRIDHKVDADELDDETDENPIVDVDSTAESNAQDEVWRVPSLRLVEPTPPSSTRSSIDEQRPDSPPLDLEPAETWDAPPRYPIPSIVLTPQ